MGGWVNALTLNADRTVCGGSNEALSSAIRRGADLRIYTEFRHNEHIDVTSKNDEMIREVSDFRVTYLMDDYWTAGIMSLRQPIELPDGFGPRPSMSFFLYNVKDTEENFCLTNNDVTTDFTLNGGDVASSHNLDTGGTYTYDHFPTGIADAAGSGEIPFGEGHLTNRRKAYEGRTRGEGIKSPALEKWIVSWTDTDPITITLDLKKVYVLNRIRLFYSGVLPEIKVQGGVDNQAWKLLGSHSGQPATADVLDITIPIEGSERYVRIDFSATPKIKAAFELAEVEIWGEGEQANNPHI